MLAAALTVAAAVAGCGDTDGTGTRPETQTTAPERDGTSTDHLPELTTTCTDEELGYEVSYPEGWHVNDDELMSPCAVFHPEPFDVPEDQELPADLAIVIRGETVPFETLSDRDDDRSVEVLSTDRVTVDGRNGVALELEATGEGSRPAGLLTYSYFIDLPEGGTLIGETHDVEGAQPSFDVRRQVLDAMIATLRFVTPADEQTDGVQAADDGDGTEDDRGEGQAQDGGAEEDDRGEGQAQDGGAEEEATGEDRAPGDDAAQEGEVPPLRGTASTERAEADATATRLAVTDVRTATHSGFDRVVFETEGDGAPGWFVEYDEPRSQGSGEPVEVAGDATLRVAIVGAAYPGDLPDGVQPWSMERLDGPSGGVVAEIVSGTIFEGQHVFFVGVDQERPFIVDRLVDPHRVVIDIFHE